MLLMIGMGLLLIGVMGFRLTTLLPGLSDAELAIQTQLANDSLTVKSLFDNPLFLPYNAVLLIMQKINADGILALRSLSVAIGLASVAGFYYVARQWFTERMALFGTLLFSTSSWFLHTARFGTPEVIYSSSIIVLAIGIWLQHSKRRIPLLSLLALSLIYIYIPGFLWFIILAGFWQYKRILKELRRVPTWFKFVFPLAVTTVLSPLIWGIIKNPSLIKQLIGLPEQLPSLSEFGSNLLAVPLELVFKGPNDPARWLGEIPLLSLFGTVMLVMGLYWSFYKRTLDRVKMLAIILVIGSFLIASNGPVSSALLIPYIYLIITFGITLMLQQWFTVFPKNIIARTTGVVLLGAVIILTVFYNFNHYFIAWPQAPETRKAFSNPPVTSVTIEGE